MILYKVVCFACFVNEIQICLEFYMNFFGFSVITRYHERFEGCHLVEILPTGLPELRKPSKTRTKTEEIQKPDPKTSIKQSEKLNDYFHVSVNVQECSGGEGGVQKKNQKIH